jgi:predicted dehydrogenase
MTRLAFQLSSYQEEFLIAASWIDEIKVVSIDENPDAIVTDNTDIKSNEKPVLLFGSLPIEGKSLITPALPKRFSPEVIALRESLDSGNLGELGLLRMHLWNQQQSDGIQEMVHAIDLALWLFGANPEHIHGTASAENEVECSLIHLGFECGGMALLDFTNSMPTGDNYESLCLIGSNGAAYADDHRNRNLFFNGGAPDAKCPDTSMDFIGPMLEDFTKRIKTGADLESNSKSYNEAFKIFSEAG